MAMPADACYDFPLLKDKVNTIVQDAVLSVLEGNVYDNVKANDWVTMVTNACIEDLKSLSPVRSCSIVLKYCIDNLLFIGRTSSTLSLVLSDRKKVEDLKSTGWGYILSIAYSEASNALDVFSGAYWDEKSDGSCTVSWENATITAVLYVYGLAI
ncbi:Dynein light chain Tctex-type 1 [Phytophthora citrophthora]|uniref:Dynein light chain Tctex-type 1 n=1 Tax=Phytophthora citrophthora TaxID=4793 RepID=A0AAD9GZ95_9STRA|nr:Dynein light chain Tctex-type 1 [Phytophthora citrophthora]